MKKGIFIQARLSSSRLPGKMLQLLGDIPLVHYVYNRCNCAVNADMVAVITSTKESDDPLYQYCKNNDILVFRGSLKNVLDRYIQAAKYFDVDLICRVCGDSPFVDTLFMDMMLHGMGEDEDYRTVTGGLNGFISEVVRLKTLLNVQKRTQFNDDLEHVTTYIRNNILLFNHNVIDMKLNPENLRHITLTIDYEQDLVLANSIIQDGLNGFGFKSQDVLDHLQAHLNSLAR